MNRDQLLEIRRRNAAMTPPGTSVSVARDELLEDLTELIQLRRVADPFGAPFERHPSSGRSARPDPG